MGAKIGEQNDFQLRCLTKWHIIRNFRQTELKDYFAEEQLEIVLFVLKAAIVNVPIEVEGHLQGFIS